MSSISCFHPGMLIAGVHSGSGKTTITTGLLRLLTSRGFTVQPYKCGPDFVDPVFHKVASGTHSVNLDTWLASAEHVQSLYQRYGAGAEISIVEGVMGLYDGYNGSQGSSAEIAQLLHLPVVLVMSARSTAYSVAPVLYGFKHFNPQVQVAGVIFNQVGSPRHLALLQKACEDVQIQCLGGVPRLDQLEMPSRHLGLATDRIEQLELFAEEAAQLLAPHIDLDQLLKVAHVGCESCNQTSQKKMSSLVQPQGGMKISVARDAAFSFIYHENLNRLQEMGTVTFFSPLTDTALPPTDLLYLPGGYPELYAQTLSHNLPMREAICQYIEQGGRTLAEGGGMIYLTQELVDASAVSFPMVGILPFGITFETMKMSMGYRDVQFNQKHWRGHEFHYSSAVSSNPIPSMATIQNAQGRNINTLWVRHKNLIATYLHLYWGDKELLNLWQ